MEKQKILQADYLDIVFDNRNKSYGGYELRQKYPDRIKRATIGVLLSVSVICAAPVVASNFSKQMPGALPFIKETTIVTSIDKIYNQPQPAPKTQPRPIKQPKVNAPAPVAATIAYNEPKIVDNNKVNDETILPREEDLKDKLVGTKTTDGDPGGKVADVGQKHGNGDGEIIEEEAGGGGGGIVDMPDEMPAFNGDVYAYLSSHMTYPEVAREQSIEGRVLIQFVVNETGNITNVEVVRGVNTSLDAEAVRVVSSMPKWKPAKVKGKPVKTYYKLPITFQLN